MESRIASLERTVLALVVAVVFLVAALAAELVLGQEQPAQQATLKMLPSDAAALALADAQRIDPQSLPFTRWVWLEQNTPLDLAAVDCTFNLLSHNVDLVRLEAVAGTNGFLRRLDIRDLVGVDEGAAEDLARIRDTLESVFDPSFHLAESVTVNVLIVDVQVMDGARVVVELPAGTVVNTSGQRREGQQGQVWVEISVEVDGENKRGWIKAEALEQRAEQVRFGLGSHAEALNALAALTGSRYPVIHFPHFAALALRSTDGGLYYQFRGWEGKTLEQILNEYGASEADVLKFESAGWAATWFSGVTSRGRAVKIFFGRGVRPTVGLPVVAFTLDFAEFGAAVAHPMLNLLAPDPVAGELIFVLPNGMLGFALFSIDGQRTELQGEVPPNIASDRELAPPPHVCRLLCPVSCLNCHAAADGFNDVKNDVLRQFGQRLAGNQPRKRANIVDDDAEENPADAIVKLVARFGADLDNTLRLVRNAHAERMARLTGGPGNVNGFTVEQVYGRIVEVYRGHVYGPVGPRQALAEVVGIEYPAHVDAQQLFNQALPPLPDNRFGVSAEHPTFIALRNGDAVDRVSWDHVKRDALLRALPAVAERNKTIMLPQALSGALEAAAQTPESKGSE